MKKDIDWIFGLKGLLALLVFVHHFFLFYYPYFSYGLGSNSIYVNDVIHRITYSPLNILGYGGELAVSCFFVISGFLICYKYTNKKTKNDEAFRYIIMRYFKLFLPVLFSSIIIYFILAIGLFRNPKVVESLNGYQLISYYSNFNYDLLKTLKECFINVFVYGESYLNPPLWTMRCELIGSFVMMLFYIVFGDNKKRYLLYILLLFIFYNTFILPFLLGGVLADILYNNKKIIDSINRIDVKIILMLATIYFMTYSYLISGWFYYKWFALLNSSDLYGLTHYIGAFLLLLLIMLSGFWQKVLSMNIIKKIGKISLEIYLLHWVIINTFSMWLSNYLLKYMSYTYSSIITLLITSVIVIGISVLFNKRIQPIIKMILDKIYKTI